jgi:hypothetical protein
VCKRELVTGDDVRAKIAATICAFANVGRTLTIGIDAKNRVPKTISALTRRVTVSDKDRLLPLRSRNG